MKRLLLDTGVYTSILGEKDKEIALKLLKMEEQKKARVYGFEVVRKELKRAPRLISTYSGNLMADLLRLYDNLTAKEYKFEQNMMDLAVAYYQNYRKLGGGISSDNLLNDFLIVACASLKELDLVVSTDKRSMLNEYAKRSYERTNSERKLKTPQLIPYEDFKEEVKKW